ncbi:MAG: hypothetical protein HC927_00115 [Deltaproteobacteria bacterium]|nr:hypothetical protein [Deltaproteobacteria bacterium]
MWFGEFIHGVMEGAYRLWKESCPPFPWPCEMTEFLKEPPPGRAEHDIGSIGDLVEVTLSAAGKSARSGVLRNSAYRRAKLAVNEIGPALFPLIESAEERVIGTRTIQMPQGVQTRSNMYELHGVMDVLSSMSMKQADESVLRSAILKCIDTDEEQTDVIVDYKGSRRPAVGDEYWKHGDWQLQTYAWLRAKQPGARRVSAGVLLYINELDPGSDDLVKLKTEIKQGRTDVMPESGSRDDYLLRTWTRGAAVPELSREFRLARMIRVIKITPDSMAEATQAFDRVVMNIEQAVAQEATTGRISGNWTPCGDEGTCAACDFRHFCPSPNDKRDEPGYEPEAPLAP